jgi:hypothetical protein
MSCLNITVHWLFSKGAKATQEWKDSLFSEWDWNNWLPYAKTWAALRPYTWHQKCTQNESLLTRLLFEVLRMSWIIVIITQTRLLSTCEFCNIWLYHNKMTLTQNVQSCKCQTVSLLQEHMGGLRHSAWDEFLNTAQTAQSMKGQIW